MADFNFSIKSNVGDRVYIMRNNNIEEKIIKEIIIPLIKIQKPIDEIYTDKIVNDEVVSSIRCIVIGVSGKSYKIYDKEDINSSQIDQYVFRNPEEITTIILNGLK